MIRRLVSYFTARQGKTRKPTRRKLARLLKMESLEYRALLASLVSDALDYAPGSTATLTVSGYQVGETVEFRVVSEAPGPGQGPWTVTDGSTADLDGTANGNVTTTWLVDPNGAYIGAMLTATATGHSSGATATTQFTDAELMTAELTGTANDVTVTQGSTANFTISVNANGPVNSAITSSSPATSSVHTAFAISAGGVLTSGTPSAAMSFFAGAAIGMSGNSTVTWTGNPTAYSVLASVSAAPTTPIGAYTITLSTASGTTTVSNPASPGLSDSTATTITVHVVAPANTAPTATNLNAAEAYTEDTALNLTHIVITDPDGGDTITATLTLSDVAAGSLSTATSGSVTSTFAGGVWTASGPLANVNTLLAGVTFNPAGNYNSNFTISTSVADGVHTAVTGSKAMTGTAVNDVPSFTVGGVVTVAEDSGAYSAAQAAGIDDGDPEVNQTLAFNVSNANNGLFLVQPSLSSSGVLTFTPAANANGSALVTVTLSDDATAGGAAITTAAQTFTINVTAVNDAPSFTVGGVVTVAEDSGAYSAAQATGIDDGDPEVNQTLAFNVSNANNGLFLVQPSISSTGVLTFTPAANANGSALVTVTLSDDATAGGAAITTAAQTFTINVTAVNDAPSANGQTVTVAEDGTVTIKLTGDDGDAEVAQALTFNVVGSPTHGTLTMVSSTATTATYSYSPGAACDETSDSFTFTVTDDAQAGSVANVTSTSATVAITITPISGVTGVGGPVLRVGLDGTNDVVTVSGGNLIVGGGSPYAGSYSLSGVTEIRIWGHSGNDSIDLSGTSINAFVSGGAGNDVVTGGAGNDVMFGGIGDDMLTGAAGYDFLIGGDGADRMVGSAGNDILAAGDVGCSQSLTALRGVASDWNAAHSLVYAETSTEDDMLVTDGDVDKLTGSAGADWFILSLNDIITEAAKAMALQGDLVTYV